MRLLNKSLQHLSKLVIVYGSIALLGGTLMFLYGLLTTYHKVSFIAISCLGLYIAGITFAERYMWTHALAFDVDRKGPIFDRRHPPVIPDFIFYVLLPDRDKEIILADLHEAYNKMGVRSRKGSMLKTKLWFWKQAITSIVPLITWRMRMSQHDGLYPAQLREDVKDRLPFYRRKATL